MLLKMPLGLNTVKYGEVLQKKQAKRGMGLGFLKNRQIQMKIMIWLADDYQIKNISLGKQKFSFDLQPFVMSLTIFISRRRYTDGKAHSAH